MAIGIVGGSGVYDPSLLKDSEQIKLKTPYGMPSDTITKGKIAGKEVYIIPRHGHEHQYNPTDTPYQANIWALKELGVTKLLTVSAVGSLKEDMRPGDFVFTDQFIDRTTKREQTFSGRVHLPMAEPFCSNLRQRLSKKARELGLRFHEKGTCVVIEGPRFSTRAESNLYRSWDADTVNMTLVPEVVLAREAEICYANIAMVTDYDCWKEDNIVSHAKVLETMKANLENVKKLLMAIIPEIDDTYKCTCNDALKGTEM